ncbi:MAG: NFACT RNA binding domain-containing protein [Candidatus Marinimicrobia bacterium]|nr:NFACT RNA binding domain-containing protein [Candidatus Neomarinimicrobiota bacterium]
MHYCSDRLHQTRINAVYTFRKARLDLHFSLPDQTFKLAWEKHGNQAMLTASEQFSLPKRRVAVLKELPTDLKVTRIRIHAQDRLLRFDLTDDFHLIMGFYPAVLNVYLSRSNQVVASFLKEKGPPIFANAWLGIEDPLPSVIPGKLLTRDELLAAQHGITFNATNGELGFSADQSGGLPINKLVIEILKYGQKPKQAPGASIRKTGKTVLKRWQVKLNKIQQELQEAASWPDLEVKLQALQICQGLGQPIQSGQLLLPAELSPTGAALSLILEKNTSYQQAIQSTAKKIRKSKGKLAQLEEIIPRIKSDMSALEDLLDQADGQNLQTFLQKHGEALDRTGRRQTERKPYKKYASPNGYDILVGRGSSDNDVLTFKVAGKNDWWFHARQIRGSHVILRTGNQQPPQIDIQKAAEYAALNSKAKHSGIVVVQYCQRKHLSKPKGSAPGAVLVQHEKSITIDLDHLGPHE